MNACNEFVFLESVAKRQPKKTKKQESIAEDGDTALSLVAEFSPDLVLLDLMLPGIDGYEVCRRIRKESQIPIIMLTARSEEQDELQGFDLGADEYITKPFSPKILVARAEALLRRSGQADAAETISLGGITVDQAAHEVRVGDEIIDLSFKEFELLVYFMQNSGIALSREKILSSVWNYDYFGDARTIDTHVKKLRAKLGSKGELIRTVWGLGYKFEP